MWGGGRGVCVCEEINVSVLQCVCVCDNKICIFDQPPLSSDWCCSGLLLVYRFVVLVLIGESLREPHSAHICHPTGITVGGGGGRQLNWCPFYIFCTCPTKTSQCTIQVFASQKNNALVLCSHEETLFDPVFFLFFVRCFVIKSSRLEMHCHWLCLHYSFHAYLRAQQSGMFACLCINLRCKHHGM